MCLSLRAEIFRVIQTYNNHEDREQEKQPENKEKVFAESFGKQVTVDDHDDQQSDDKNDRQ